MASHSQSKWLNDMVRIALRHSKRVRTRISSIDSSTAAKASESLTNTKSYSTVYKLFKIPSWLSIGKNAGFASIKFTRSYSANTVKAIRNSNNFIAGNRPLKRTHIVAHRAAFGSTLRPKLTGGTLPRSPVGYSLGFNGSSSRFFSSSAPTSQIVSNVTQGIRAMLLNSKDVNFNKKSHFTNLNLISNSNSKENYQQSQMTNFPFISSFVDFDFSPLLVSVLSKKSVSSTHESELMDSEVFIAENLTYLTPETLDCLKEDIESHSHSLDAIMHDLKALSQLGELQVTIEDRGRQLRVHFPGVEASTVQFMCLDKAVTRGIIHQTEKFEMPSMISEHNNSSFTFTGLEDNSCNEESSVNSVIYEEFNNDEDYDYGGIDFDNLSSSDEFELLP